MRRFTGAAASAVASMEVTTCATKVPAAFGAAMARLAAAAPVPPRLLLVAVSGGADSVALAALTAEWAAAALPRVAVVGATVDHGFRPESAGEAAAVAAWLTRLSMPHISHRLDWGAAGIPAHNALESVARSRRYAALSRVAKLLGADAILLAHHADDQAETSLFRLARASGLWGLGGMHEAITFMPPTPDHGDSSEISALRAGAIMPLWRPLLGVSKAALAGYCSDHRLPTHHDASNADEAFDRVRVRHGIAELAAGSGSGGGPLLTREQLYKASAALQRARDLLASAGASCPLLGHV